MLRVILAALTLAVIPISATAQFIIPIPIPAAKAKDGPLTPVAFQSRPEGLPLTAFYEQNGILQESSCTMPCTMVFPWGSPLRFKVGGAAGYTGYKNAPGMQWIQKAGKKIANPNPVIIELNPNPPAVAAPPLIPEEPKN